LATAPFTLFAIAAPGLEPVVAKELTQLGEQPRPEDGGVGWTGDARSLMRANLWLRSASRVVVRVAEFRATAFFELEKQAKRIDWSPYLGAGVAPEFRVTAKKSKLYHSDAIAERLLSALGSRLSASREPRAQSPKQLFVVRMHRDTCTISADASGELLHMRGYRQAIGKAPLRETLAAAMLIASGWNGDEALMDPFCGSGTIPIEAALIARGMAPGMNRGFAFERWPGFDSREWQSLKDDARSRVRPTTAIIQGSDRDAGAIAASEANATRAGVAEAIEFQVNALSAAAPTAPSGLVATNPPYGKRVSEGRDVRNLYAQLGKWMRNLPNWRLCLLSADDRLAKQVDLPLEQLLKTSNGGIPIKLLSSARFLHFGPRG
jgi:putative N6-adenine-specific DNA methylase